MLRVVDRVHAVCCFISASCILLLMAGVIVDVVMRSVLGQPLRGFVDYGETGIVLCAFIALGYAQRERSHVAVDTLANALPRPAAVAMQWGVCLIVLPLLLWLTVETAELAIESYNTGEYRFGLTKVPLWPMRAMLPVGLALWAVEILKETVEMTLGRREPDRATEAEHSA